jgi:uncharacterized protein
VEVEWDPRKASVNLRRHGVDFADAGTVLHDEQAITIRDEGSDEEDRFITLGIDALGRSRGCLHVPRRSPTDYLGKKGDAT